MTLTSPSVGGRRRGRRDGRRWALILAAVVGLGMVVWVVVSRMTSVVEHRAERRTIDVVLPPPPPPPPPVEQPPPPEKTVTPQQAEPTPQPPTPQVQPKGDDALTAREGPGAGNYGLRAGDGSGSRIGGKVGGDPFGAYAQLILAEVRRETQNDPQLTNLDYTARFRVTLNTSGEVVDAVSLDAGLDRKLEALLRARLLKIKLSTPPPSGLPPVKIEISSRSQF